jgi:putative Mg2+ transporter-C (MgtC) family protein
MYGGWYCGITFWYNCRMKTFFDPATVNIVLDLFTALVLGMLIGLERLWAHKTASMRTYALVSMGSALFVITSNIMSYAYMADFKGTNPLVIIAEIVVGIGFIGTGLIFARDSKLMGLTTATGLWVSAGIGMASGFGLYKLAVIATFFTLFIFVVLWFIEQQLKKMKFFQHINDDTSVSVQ